MTTQRTLIGTIPIKEIEQEVTEFMEQVAEDSSVILGVFDLQDDPEGRSEITTDSDGKIISYRDSDGVKHENIGIETDSASINHLNLTESGMTEFQQALKDSGFNPGGRTDWSNAKKLQIPTPRCILINITSLSGNAEWPWAKELDLQYYLEFWDMQGNYFKKAIIANAQGNSSLAAPKKNIGFDICNDEWEGDDTFSLRIGDWVPQDSFHVKAYWDDFFVAAGPTCYKFFDKIVATRGLYKDRDWKKNMLPDKDSITNASFEDDLKVGFDNKARCYPDGIPCIAYLNGDFYGVFSWQLKKHRDNYMMSKKKPKNIHLDGQLYFIWKYNGNINWDVFSGSTESPWGESEGVEIRNPKPKKKKDGWDLTCIDETKYDGDNNRKELIGSDNVGIYDETNESHVKTNQTKQAIIRLSTYIPHIISMESTSTAEEIKEYMESCFDVESLIDYLIFCDIVWNEDGLAKNWQWITWDGIKWFVEPYDLDRSLGWFAYKEIDPESGRLGNDLDIPTGWLIKYFTPEIEARYAELRGKEVITAKTITDILHNWLQAVGEENYSKNVEKWPCLVQGVQHFDNIYRVYNWMEKRIAKCDEIYNYNQ